MSDTGRTYRVRVYGSATVDIEANSPEEAGRKATSQIDNGELTLFVDGTPEKVERSEDTGGEQDV